MLKSAEFSPDRKHRYSLWRIWDPIKPCCTFIGLNPSIADEDINDHTVTRCANYAKDWGYGGMYMLNLFSFRATYPAVMKCCRDHSHSSNNLHILRIVFKCSKIICAWGNHGSFENRDQEILRLLRGYDLYCLDISKTGQPKHPLYLKKDLVPKIYHNRW